MARNIQAISSGGRGELAAFLRAVVSAILWIGVAAIFPFAVLPELVPGLAPYAHWFPLVFYALAAGSFIQGIRALNRLANAWLKQPGVGQSGGRQRGIAAAAARHRPAGARVPTVQRMR